MADLSESVDLARAEAGARREAARATSRARPRRELPLFLLPGLLLLLFLAVPIVALFWRALGMPDFWPSLGQPLVLQALRLSAITSTITLGIALVAGTPLALVLARRSFPGKRLVETLVDLPLVLPPVVAGVALLMAFGRVGVLGRELDWLGIEIPFTTAAVVMAQLFVAVPFYVRGAKVGFLAVAPEVEEAAALDGADAWATFRHVTLPLALPGIGSGLVLCWARALSEFGATLMFAGNFMGRTQTMPLAIMTALETNLSATLALAVLLVVVSASVLILSRLVTGDRFAP